MPSDTVKKVTGMFIQDSCASLPAFLAWLTQECRAGTLAQPVKKFCEAQSENLDQALVIVDSITNERIRCRIPFAAVDHEAVHPFHSEISFDLNPVTGESRRV